MYAAFGFFEHHFQLIQYAIAGAIGFLIGSEIPFATRINEDFRGVSLPNNLAAIFLWDYLGGFIGAVIFTKFLMPRVPLTEMSFLLGAVVLAVALLNYVYFMDAKRLVHYAAFVIVALALFLSSCGLFMDSRGQTTSFGLPHIIFVLPVVIGSFVMTLFGVANALAGPRRTIWPTLVAVAALFATVWASAPT